MSITEIVGICTALEETGITIKQANGDVHILEIKIHGDLPGIRPKYLDKMISIFYSDDAENPDFRMRVLEPNEPLIRVSEDELGIQTRTAKSFLSEQESRRERAAVEAALYSDPEKKETEVKLELMEITRLVSIVDRPNDMMEITISKPKNLSSEVFNDWFVKFMKSGLGQFLINKPDAFKTKPDHDWSHPTIMGLKLLENYVVTYDKFGIKPDNRIPKAVREEYMTRAFEVVVEAIGGRVVMAGALAKDNKDEARNMQTMIQFIAYTYYCDEVLKLDVKADLEQIQMLKTALQRESIEIPIPMRPSSKEISKRKNDT
jgi:hypothetical protein